VYVVETDWKLCFYPAFLTDSDFEPFFRVRDGWKGCPGIGCDIAAVEMSDDFARISGIPKQGAFFYCSCEKCGLNLKPATCFTCPFPGCAGNSCLVIEYFSAFERH
jgi:hypothetical protein